MSRFNPMPNLFLFPRLSLPSYRKTSFSEIRAQSGGVIIIVHDVSDSGSAHRQQPSGGLVCHSLSSL